LAVAATFIYLIVATVFSHLSLASSPFVSVIFGHSSALSRWKGVLREVLALATARGFALSEISTEAIGYQRAPEVERGQTSDESPMVSVTMHVRGQPSSTIWCGAHRTAGVDAVLADDANFDAE